MGSRRRPVRWVSEEGSSSEPYLQLLPTVKKGLPKYEVQDYLGHQKWRVKEKPAIHPALTNYGPQSLQTYLRRALNLQLQLLDSVQQELRSYALSLVNAPGNIYVAKENGLRVLKAGKAKGFEQSASSTKTDHRPSEKKGKKPLRKNTNVSSRTNSDDSQTPFQGFKRPEMKCAAHAARRSSRTVSGRLYLNNQIENGEVIMDGHSDTIAKPRAASLSIWSPDRNADAHEHSPKLGLSRASSFENHVSSSRLSRRSKEKCPSTSASPPGEPGRRRKTPAQSPTENSNQPDQPFEHLWQDNPRLGTNLSEIQEVLDMMQTEESISIGSPLGISQLTDEQTAILASYNERARPCGNSNHAPIGPPEFDYEKIMPEEMPLNIVQAETNRCKIWEAYGFDAHGKPLLTQESQRHPEPLSKDQVDPTGGNILNAPDDHGDYPRRYSPPRSSRRVDEPSYCYPTNYSNTLPAELWEIGVLEYLSSAEVRSLRLVCRSIAEDLGPYMFRSVVTKFCPSMLNLKPSYDKDGRINVDKRRSMLETYGPRMNKFGISFEYDACGLMHAPFKETEKHIDAWFGHYKWPIAEYPYFDALKEIDKVLDDECRLLTQAMTNLGNCHELGLSIDSGHGWLEGPDVSDLAIYRERANSGSRVFGKAFSATDRAHEEGMKHLFEWAQINTINENIKYLDGRSPKSKEELERLRKIIVRPYDHFRCEKSQPDYKPHLHTGGLAVDNNGGQNQTTPIANAINNTTQNMANQLNNALPMQQRLAQAMRVVRNHLPTFDANEKTVQSKREAIQPQWPIIFNGYNLAAESRGDSTYVQSRMACPSDFPLLPGILNEAQVQWLMETSWIQRTFLSAYTDAVRVNSSVLQNVHSLHITKISSGLLPALSQKSFWTSLPSLKKVTLLVKPDWRVEHIPGDKFFESTMATSPINAAVKLAELLRDQVARLENLNSLHVGFVGGGEHQKGIFGRNQHVLPAPITSNPRDWLLAQNPSNVKPSGNTMFVFPHVRTLTFQNCWFNPYMLETFMHKSRDTSLYNLVLDSVSLTAQVHSSRTDGPLRTVENGLQCLHTPSAWLNEVIPPNASWVNTLDRITPGPTILDKKYDANMINEEETPRLEPEFRGNIQQISLNSCGYVKVIGVGSNDFNQNELVCQNSSWSAMDEGLKARANIFNKTVALQVPPPESDDRSNDQAEIFSIFRGRRSSRGSRNADQRGQQVSTSSRFIMLAGKQGHVRSESVNGETGALAMTGYLTQCIHPVEKRVLEQMWGMRFGWGDDMARWEAVEDGWFMGGTGRFNGELFRDGKSQAAFNRQRRHVDDSESEAVDESRQEGQLNHTTESATNSELDNPQVPAFLASITASGTGVAAETSDARSRRQLGLPFQIEMNDDTDNFSEANDREE